MKRLLVTVAALSFATTLRAALPTPDPDDGAIKLPPGFRALVFADNLGPLRFLTVAPNGVPTRCPRSGPGATPTSPRC